MTFDEFLSRLKKVTKSGNQWKACCPAHEDHNPSLSIRKGKGGRILVKCFAHCSHEAVCMALGIPVSALFAQQDKPSKAKWGRVAKEYDYRDSNGALLYQIQRDVNKNFRVRRPNGNGGWIHALGHVGCVLYRLPELVAANPNETVFILEGEKDVDRVWNEGLAATTNPFGACKWSKLSDDSSLVSRRVVIIPDNDGAGRKHALDVARRLYGRAKEVRIIELPDEVHDVSDWFDAGGTQQELMALVESSMLFEGTAPQHWESIDAAMADKDDDNKNEEENVSRSQATLLVDLCNELEFFHDDETAYASERTNGRLVTRSVRSRKFKTWLARRYYVAYGRTPGSQALTDAISVLEGRALFDGPQIRAHVRIASHGSAIFLALGDEAQTVIEVRSDGWGVCADPPVRFRHTRAMMPLPMPVRGGSLSLLRKLLNITSDRDFVLVCAWLVAAFRPEHPTPILGFSSEQGSGKTSAARMLRMLIDPNQAPVRAEPNCVRDLMISAQNSHVQVVDNSSYMPDWMSDAFCRMSTGGGFSTRELFENDEECIFTSLRPIILTGIEEVGTRSDLLDRMIRLHLPTIPESRRKPERQLYSEFDNARPLILGAILDAVCMALRNIDTVEIPAVPRMADFAQFIVAAEPALPWERGTFMQAYGENRGRVHELAIEASPIGDAVRAFSARQGNWFGTASQLLVLLKPYYGHDAPKGWPRTPHHLSGHLRRIAPNLREVGIHVEFLDRTRHGRSLTIRNVGATSVTSVTERQEEADGAADFESGDARDAGDASAVEPSLEDE